MTKKIFRLAFAAFLGTASALGGEVGMMSADQIDCTKEAMQVMPPPAVPPLLMLQPVGTPSGTPKKTSGQAD